VRLFAYYAGIFVAVLQFAIVLRAMLSWFPTGQDNPLVRIVNQITEPVLAPLRRVVPRLGMVDLTPMAAILILFVIREALARLG
jgi:YggT family protein